MIHTFPLTSSTNIADDDIFDGFENLPPKICSTPKQLQNKQRFIETLI